MRQSYHKQQLELTFPGLQARAFKGQFALIIPQGHFHLSATGISKNDLPGILRGQDAFIGEQIPGLSSLTRSSHH
jgi:hypothetical protein